jgi:hypothetical protein
MPPTSTGDSGTLAQNTSGALYQMYTATFGNMNFQIAPSLTGEVSNSFGTVPYVSLESIIYAQQMNAQTSPTNIMSGQNTGTQNVQGAYTVTDQNGLTRLVMGYQSEGF